MCWVETYLTSYDSLMYSLNGSLPAHIYNNFSTIVAGARGAASPVGLSVCWSIGLSVDLLVCLSVRLSVNQLWNQRSLQPPSTPKTSGPVPQVLKKVVNLSCYFYSILK